MTLKKVVVVAFGCAHHNRGQAATAVSCGGQQASTKYGDDQRQFPAAAWQQSAAAIAGSDH